METNMDESNESKGMTTTQVKKLKERILKENQKKKAKKKAKKEIKQ